MMEVHDTTDPPAVERMVHIGELALALKEAASDLDNELNHSSPIDLDVVGTCFDNVNARVKQLGQLLEDETLGN